MSECVCVTLGVTGSLLELYARGHAAMMQTNANEAMRDGGCQACQPGVPATCSW